MRRRIVGIVLGGVVLFAFMAFVYPLVRGQPLWNVPWIVISAIAATIAAPIADLLSQRRKSKNIRTNEPNDQAP